MGEESEELLEWEGETVGEERFREEEGEEEDDGEDV